MVIQIGIGWWLVPLAVTVASFGFALYLSSDREPDPYGAGAVISLIFLCFAAIVSLLFWLLWVAAL